jgi:molybdate transport system regulatory protein
MIALRLQLKVGAESRIGHGKIRLLQEVEETGSISAASRALGMNYRRGWELIDQMNKAFGHPVVSGTSGGLGGAALTDLGRDIVARYRALEADVLRIATPHLAALEALLKSNTSETDRESEKSGPDPEFH